MTSVTDVLEFEQSKENIQPIQQGRKAEILRSALAPQPEDKLTQQRRVFEQELRSYSGEDPLSVWCDYIKWVEQNYPKGGREGNISKLIQQCLLILKDEKQYYDDDRFVDIWIKFANISVKPMEVYGNMFTRGIGCLSARFYIAWAWEAEQLGNLKQADEILTAGINRNAQPMDSLKTTHKELSMRLTQIIAAENENVKCNLLEEPEQRSAFTMLKTQSKNKAPVSRIGESTIPTNRQNMTLNQQKSKPKNSQAKIPFKIYSGDNENSSLPAQNKKCSSTFSVNSEGIKENEKKPSKWNKVKIQQTAAHVRDSSKPQEFVFHCDTTPQPDSVKKLPQSTQVLTSRKEPWDPPVALFEPPDPMKVPMYNKMKVYGGAEEFSFEEIRAAKWFEAQRKAEKERKRLLEEQEKEEMKKQMKQLQEKIQLLESIALPVLQQNVKSENTNVESVFMAKEDKIVTNDGSLNPQLKTSTPLASPSLSLSTHIDCSGNLDGATKNDPTFLRQLSREFAFDKELNASSITKAYTLGTTCMANEVDCMMAELYNGTLGSNPALDKDLSFAAQLEKNYNPLFDNLSKNSAKPPISPTVDDEKIKFAFDFPPLPNESIDNSTKKSVDENKPSGFAIFHDPTEILPKKREIAPFPVFSDFKELKINDENAPPSSLCKENPSCPSPFNNDSKNKKHENTDDVFSEPQFINTENVAKKCSANIEDIENIPPTDYMQPVVEKRELAGILEPSKNIHYIPLEKQLEAEADEEEEDEIGHGFLGVRPLDDNLTMLTAEQFAAAACFMSTPCVKPQTTGVRETVQSSEKAASTAPVLPESNIENTVLIQALSDAFLLADSEKVKNVLKQVILDITKRKDPITTKESNPNVIELLKSCYELSNSEKLKAMVQHCVSIIETLLLKNRDLNQTNVISHYHTLQLSTIMETSRESKSSSSSGSCMTSMLKLKSMHNSTHLNSASKFTKPSIIDAFKKSASVLTEETEFESDEKVSEVPVDHKVKDESAIQYDIDPFDPALTSGFLKSLKKPVAQREDFFDFRDTSLHIKIGSFINLGNINCLIESLYAEGAYAKVYSGQCPIGENSYIDFSQTILPTPKFAIKVCKNANEWEFYICSELMYRLQNENHSPDITNSIMTVKSAMAFQNCLVLVSDLFEMGTLLDVVNAYKSQKTRVPECVVMFFALEMLQILSGIHRCGIVHGDVKPDNFMLNHIPDFNELESVLEQPNCLRLIDFGRAIDMTLFKPSVAFNIAVKTDGFQCVQMREGRPWVYETDWYGVLGCIHILLFNEYMDVRKTAEGSWEPVLKFKRYFQTDIWQPLFHALLNIPSYDKVPDVLPFVTMLTERLKQQMKDFKVQVMQMNFTLGSRSRGIR